MAARWAAIGGKGTRLAVTERESEEAEAAVCELRFASRTLLLLSLSVARAAAEWCEIERR